jgi:hypothetical protein
MRFFGTAVYFKSAYAALMIPIPVSTYNFGSNYNSVEPENLITSFILIPEPPAVEFSYS